MNLCYRYFNVLILSPIFVISACQRIDPAIQECQQLLEKVNVTVVEAQKLTESGQTTSEIQPLNLEAWLQAADVLKKGAEAIAALSITDKTLKTHQSQIAKIYQNQAQATYDMVKARQTKNLDAALAAQKLSQSAGAEEQQVGKALNDYCQAKEQKFRSRTGQ